MAISPGAPMALRNALGAGGHRGFAPSLQIAVALLAALSMPLSIAALDRYYEGAATVTPLQVAKQVFAAQLLPLALGMVLRRAGAGVSSTLVAVRGLCVGWMGCFAKAASKARRYYRGLLREHTMEVRLELLQVAKGGRESPSHLCIGER